jgi:hypothetical protein
MSSVLGAVCEVNAPRKRLRNPRLAKERESCVWSILGMSVTKSEQSQNIHKWLSDSRSDAIDERNVAIHLPLKARRVF